MIGDRLGLAHGSAVDVFGFNRGNLVVTFSNVETTSCISLARCQ